MKPKWKIFLTIMVGIRLLIPNLSYADGAEGKGADLTASRRKNIYQFVSSGLKAKAYDALNKLNNSHLSDSVVAGMLRNMNQRGLLVDISRTKYVTKANCTEAGIRKSSSTQSGRMGAPVCFNLNMLAELNASIPEIVGLAFHEHAHHFGYSEASAIRLERYVASNLKVNEQNLSRNRWSCSATCAYTFSPISNYGLLARQERVELTAEGKTAAEAFQLLIQRCNAKAFKFRSSSDADPYPELKVTLDINGKEAKANVRNACTKN